MYPITCLEYHNPKFLFTIQFLQLHFCLHITFMHNIRYRLKLKWHYTSLQKAAQFLRLLHSNTCSCSSSFGWYSSSLESSDSSCSISTWHLEGDCFLTGVIGHEIVGCAISSSLQRSKHSIIMYSSLTNKCTFYFKKHIKIYIKIHINIAPTCFSLRMSSGSLHWTWLKLYLC